MTTDSIISKVWSFCNTLRDDGVGYGDYRPTNRHQRKETWHAEKNPAGRWRKFTRAELVARDKTSLDLFWLKDDSFTDLDNLPEPEILAEEIIDNIEAGLASFRMVASALGK